MQIKASFLYFLVIGFLCSCNPEKSEIKVRVSNPLDLKRNIETVVVPTQKLQPLLNSGLNVEDILVLDEQKDTLVRQLIDTDQNGTPDELLFQVQLDANEESVFYLQAIENGSNRQPQSNLTTYSRIVPERTDDYTWENDKVAFRTYGMEAQRLVEEKKPGGTLSSGIDLWLKRVEYSIIDDWYKKNSDSTGYYHKDHGEGYDPYHVGKSRGTGGIGVWRDDTLITSKNFIGYRTIATGPIRTVFELDYAPWSEFEIVETKRISLDLGSNFSKFEISLESKKTPPNYTIGITLHDGSGETNLSENKGCFRHWESIDDSFLGEGIVLSPDVVLESFVHNSKIRDQSQLLVVTKPQSKLEYYAGFAWQKSGQVEDVSDWDEQLNLQALYVQNPLKVHFQ